MGLRADERWRCQASGRTDGQLGDGNEGQDTNTPVDVSGLTNGVGHAISANALHARAFTTAGHVECWGSTFDDEEVRGDQ